MADTGSISGTVRDSQNNPIENQTVWINSEDGTFGESACTDASGVFTFSGLVLDRNYYIQSGGDNSCTGLLPLTVHEFWDNSHNWPGTLIPVTAASPDVTGKNFTLEPAGYVSGTVTDSTTGSPLENINVSVHLESWGMGACTDSSGQYIISGVPLNTDIRVSARSGDNWCGGPTNYVQQQQDGITLTTPGENQDRDFALQTGFVISGTVSNGSGTLLENIWIGTENKPYGDCTDANGVYSMIVPAGDYVLRGGSVCGSSTSPWAEMLYENTFDINT